MRTATINRKTAETDVSLTLTLEGTGKAKIDTGVGFLDHMLTLFAAHGHFDLDLVCRGDLQVDAHHSTEDIGIALGQAFSAALGDKRGIARYGDIMLPMDEALVLCAVDLSGRDCLVYDVPFPTEKIGDFDCELVEEFFCAFTREVKAALHLGKLAGKNSHHIAEACFKAFGRVLSAAVSPDPRGNVGIPSTKGVL